MEIGVNCKAIVKVAPPRGKGVLLDLTWQQTGRRLQGQQGIGGD